MSSLNSIYFRADIEEVFFDEWWMLGKVECRRCQISSRKRGGSSSRLKKKGTSKGRKSQLPSLFTEPFLDPIHPPAIPYYRAPFIAKECSGSLWLTVVNSSPPILSYLPPFMFPPQTTLPQLPSSRLPMISILLKSTVRVSRLILLNGSAASDISDHWLLEILSLLDTQEGTLYCFVSPLIDCTVPISLLIPPLYPSFVSWMLKHFISKACVSLLNGSLVRLPLTTSALLPWSEPLSSLTWLLQQLPSWSSASCTSVCPQHGRQRGPVKIRLVMSLLHKTLPWLSVSLRVKVEVLTVSFKTPSGPTTYQPASLILLLSHCHSSTPDFSLLLQSDSRSLCQDLWEGPGLRLEGSFLRCLHGFPLVQLALIATMLITETSPYLLREVYPITPDSHSQHK